MRTTVKVGTRTCYELTAEHLDGRRLLVAYTDRKTRHTLCMALQDRIEHVDRVIQTRAVDWCDRAAGGAVMAGWRICWSGRTEREARRDALPYLGDTGALS